MNIIVMVHRGDRLELADVWRRFGEWVVALDNADCGHDYAWADEVITWPNDPGHNGLEQCRRHLRGAREAAKLSGVTALLEGDAFLTRDDFEVLPDVLYGSRLYDAWSFRDVRNYMCRWFVHPPYVADRATWGKIAEVLGWWLKSGRVCDEGHNDRVLCLAAQAAQVRVEGIGWSRNTVTDADAASLAEALADGVALIHGVKDVKYIQETRNQRPETRDQRPETRQKGERSGDGESGVGNRDARDQNAA